MTKNGLYLAKQPKKGKNDPTFNYVKNLPSKILSVQIILESAKDLDYRTLRCSERNLNCSLTHSKFLGQQDVDHGQTDPHVSERRWSHA